MTVQCIACQNFSLQDAGKEFAALGFGQCSKKVGMAHQSARYPRECSTFSPADEGVAEKREAWLKGRQA